MSSAPLSSALEAQILYQVANAPLRAFPYAHIYVPNVFPADFYAEIVRNIPDPSAMTPIEEARPVKGYKERFVLDPAKAHETLPGTQGAFWKGLDGLLTAGAFRDVLISRFQPWIQKRFGSDGFLAKQETLLVEDITNYALGPHTDAPSKVVTVLFYLPKDESQAHLGTSIYVPKERGRRCPGGPHYGYEGFDRVATMPFLPNSMFAFVKTDNSFHGVEPVTEPDVRRWLLLYDIKGQKAETPVGKAEAAQA